jgi:serine/threonine protein kinase/tetratricopeptide (TPR) repeat protein
MADPLALLKIAVADRYAIERELGRGGMATVYLARDLRHRRVVAVKLLRAELAGPIGPERFLREIEIAAGLSHPHILPLFDSGGSNGLLYYVMPYIEGESLRQRLDREGQLPIEDAVRITREVGEALGYAHGLGFVHRDIKPANILLSHNHAVVADFGIARAISAAGGEQLTETGLSLGTPAYMSPEQALGGSEVDGRSDLYSLGCVLYEMLVGDPPFLGHSPQQILARHVMDPVPSPRTVRASVPPALEQALLRALAKAPVDRYATVPQFIEALGALQVSGPQATVILRSVPPARSIAVLPFVNLSGDPENEYFGDGLAEELLNLLSGIKGLRVASRTSSFAFKGTKTDLRAIGQTLNVQHVLEGSVRKAGNRIRVTAQLTGAADGFDLWSGRYDRELSDVFAIQDEIARTIVDALQVQLTGEQAERLAKRGTADPEAYDCYLKGRHHWNNRPIGIRKAVEYFKEAVAKDPGYALAYTGLADCYGSMGGWEGNAMRPHEAWPKAAAAARRALELDEGLGEAHTSLGHVHLHYDWDWRAAEREFRRAMELHPTYSTAHHWSSHLAMARGQTDLSLAESRRCLELDPVDLVINVHLIWHYWLAGQPDEAIEQGCKTRELHPNAFWPEFFIGLACEDKLMPDAAVTHLDKAATMSTGSTFVLAALGHAYAAAGRPERALELLRELDARGRERYVPAYDRAVIYAGLNRIDPALAWLQRAYDERSSWMSYLKVEPRLDVLRSDSRFATLLRKVGLE